MAKTTKKTEEKKTFSFADAQELARKAARITIGGYAKAYELARDAADKGVAEAKSRFENLTKQRDELVKELEEKGSKVETLAEKNFKDARSNVIAFAEPRIEKIRSLVPSRTAKADQVAELEAEIAKLNKKLASLTKAAPAKKAPAKKAPAKTTAKKPAAKAAAKPVAAKTEAKPAAATSTAATTTATKSAA